MIKTDRGKGVIAQERQVGLFYDFGNLHNVRTKNAGLKVYGKSSSTACVMKKNVWKALLYVLRSLLT